MTTTVEVKTTCWRCQGDGLLGPENQRTCNTCNGSGEVIIGTIDMSEIENKLKTKLNNIRDQIIAALS